ncbi:MAG TPA: hypothetical protein VFF42_09190 [Candidatus Eremiobacteraceae bacterium]|nr:hypothetical protein [Candidatus Eremiobacteraceae bacterium]
MREIIALPRLGPSDLSMALAVVPIRFATPLPSDLSMAPAVVPIRLP